MKTNFQEHHLIQALKRFENQSRALDLFLNEYFRSHKALGATDRKFIAEWAYEMTRWRLLLDHLIGGMATWEKRVNCYHSFNPMSYTDNESIPLYVRASFPQNLFTLLMEEYGRGGAVRLCQALNTAAPTTIRVNPLKCSRDAFFDLWSKKYSITKCVHSPYGIKLQNRPPLFGSSEFKEGLFEMQDEASQLVSLLVNAQPGEHILDFCAGSGGKSLAFAHKLEGKGQIYLHDIRPTILKEARKRLKRAGIQNGQCLPAGHKQFSKLHKRMDWVIVDAPCSGTGVLRRNPDQKWKFSLELLTRLIDQQRTIFADALNYVRPGGKIIYATCSILRAENQAQLAYFLSHHPLKIVGEPFVSLPTIGGMDGFFAGTLEKIA